MIDYFNKTKKAMDSIDMDILKKVIRNYSRIVTNISPLLIFGNGGSAAIANHAATDLTKAIYEDGNYTFSAISLCSNIPLITAISNDIGYTEVFSRQIKYLDLPTADVLAISSSGNSQNVINGLTIAKTHNYYTAALVGFDGGEILASQLADDIIHVKSDNYGIIEDCHMMIIHAIAQEIRKGGSIHPEKLKL
jgi:phosphoheptose isomerase